VKYAIIWMEIVGESLHQEQIPGYAEWMLRIERLGINPYRLHYYMAHRSFETAFRWRDFETATTLEDGQGGVANTALPWVKMKELMARCVVVNDPPELEVLNEPEVWNPAGLIWKYPDASTKSGYDWRPVLEVIGIDEREGMACFDRIRERLLYWADGPVDDWDDDEFVDAHRLWMISWLRFGAWFRATYPTIEPPPCSGDIEELVALMDEPDLAMPAMSAMIEMLRANKKEVAS
jgi:hypothetical protein